MSHSSPGPVNFEDDLSELIGLHYGELRRIAAYLFKQERIDHTLQPTALVNELYLRLREHGPDRYTSRTGFFVVAVRNMRQILIDHARKHNAQKRGARQTVSLDGLDVASPEGIDWIGLDTAIARLEGSSAELGRIAELRVFGGLSSKEIGEVLDLGESTVRKKWDLAKTWLQRELGDAFQ